MPDKDKHSDQMPSEFGGQSMIAPLRRVLVKRPDSAFAVDDPKLWNYTGRPDLEAAQREHDAFAEILRGAGAEVLYHSEAQPHRADSIYVTDPSLMTDRGAVILKMGKDLRRGEETALARCYESLGIPIVFTLHGDARAEAGDLLWLDAHTLAVGQGFRTNAEGLRQLRAGLAELEVEVIPVELPYFHGPIACLHLLSMISLVDHDLAVVYPSLLSVPFWKSLQDLGYRFVEVPESEFPTMAPNVLALAPGKCLMVEGNPITRRRLEKVGCEVLTYRGQEISCKAEGGPTCLTRPLLRR